MKKLDKNWTDCDGLRVLSASEIIQAEEDLHVNFIEKQFLPVADCGDNNFVVYHFADNS